LRCVTVGGMWLGLIVCPAGAEIIVAVDKSKQLMTVAVDGREQHVWPVSTGLGGGPKTGIYRPERLERKWFSRKYNMSPMPHAIFFHEGYAIHGTIYVSLLGNRASHGCVRLHPTNAAILFDLVRGRRMRDTTIIVSNSEYVMKPSLATMSGVLEMADAPESTSALPVSAITVVTPELEE